MNRLTLQSFFLALSIALVSILAVCLAARADEDKTIGLLNVSYDPTRELYTEYNAAFSKFWKEKTGESVKISMSHGGSGKQARSVVDGNDADIVTLALSQDIDMISKKAELLPADWQKRLPHNSTPYTSTIVFVVRKGNPKNIKDWSDVGRAGVVGVAPNPKTGGGARWIYLAAWGYALKQPGGSDATARELVSKIYHNIAVLGQGMRDTTTSFANSGVGDVELTFENEAFLILKEFGADKYEIVVPSKSILCEPSVAWVDKNVEKHGTGKIAEAYLKHLYDKEGQEIAARNFYRPTDPEVLAKFADKFLKVDLFTIDEVFGGWTKAQKTHFDNGGVFDQIMKSISSWLIWTVTVSLLLLLFLSRRLWICSPRTSRVSGGMLFMRKTFAPIVLRAPMVVSPPRMIPLG